MALTRRLAGFGVISIEPYNLEGAVVGPLVELVITAPEPYGAELALRAGARMTLGALVELVAHAERYVVISAPFVQMAADLGNSLLVMSLGAALKRGVRIDVVSTGSGLEGWRAGGLESLGQGRMRGFRPAANIANERQMGSHAKFCLADGLHAYIGSANLTAGGLHAHLEMGVLVHGELARQLERFWDYLVDIKFFVEV